MTFEEFFIENWYLFAALVVVLILLAQGSVVQMLYKIKSVGSAQVINLINRESAIVVDVCEPNEYEQGHIPNAINIPLGSLASRLDELDKYKDQPVVVACRSGNRSMKGAIALSKNGFQSVFSLSGGLLAWQKGNLPVEK
jgi:rhodanese-related sulfurtransferase